MKITITGSLGHIGKYLAKDLVAKGHETTVISSNAQKQNDIVSIGAIPAIGNLEDHRFLTKTFEKADAVFTMFPPFDYRDPDLDVIANYEKWARAYAQAISSANVKHVVNLSSIGAHLDKGNGIIAGAFLVEKILNELPSDFVVTHIRPSSFYTNLLGYISTIKSDEKIYANFGSKVMPWASPKDIATAIREELERTAPSRGIRYVVSEELSGHEIAHILGQNIGKSDLRWEIISDAEVENKLISSGVKVEVARQLTEMYAALQSGLMATDYWATKPHEMGQVKLMEFAGEFATLYHGN